MCMLQPFARRQDGGIAIIFALTFPVLVLSAGIAIDYGRSFSISSTLQNGLDAAVLSAATGSGSESEALAAASSVFNANWREKHGVTSVSVSFEKSKDRITGSAIANVATSFMRITGIDYVPVRAVSAVVLGGEKVEVALVLDTTGSMTTTKLAALKSASKSMITSAYQMADADKNVKFGIVPFGEYVNVGMANRNAPWMDVPLDTSKNVETCGMESPVIGRSNCRVVTNTGYTDGVPYSYESTNCDEQFGTAVNVCRTSTWTYAWYGCAGSRTYPLNTLDDQYSSRIPGLQNVGCGAEMSPLTNDKDALNSKIDELVANGETYIPSGLVWGWRILSKEAPFTDADNYGKAADGTNVRKVMVLMTDGANTKSKDPASGFHSGNDVTDANKLSAELCNNIKAKGIFIYAVAYEVTDATIRNLLSGCATTSGNYYDASNAAELNAAFVSIGKNLSPLRLVK